MNTLLKERPFQKPIYNLNERYLFVKKISVEVMKRVLITAGIHGNETASILLAREIKGWIEGSGISNVEVLPEANKKAVESNQRNNPEDDKDLNRVFPGKKNGSDSEKIAYEIFHKAKEFDFVIDLHTYGENRVCIPHIISDIRKDYNRNLASRLGIKYAIQTKMSSRQLFSEISNIGKPAVLIEICGANTIIEKDMEEVKKGLKDFIDRGKEKNTTFFDEYEKIRPSDEGYFIPAVKPGETIEKGSKIGTIDGKVVISDVEGTVLGIQTESTYNPESDYVVSVAKTPIKNSN